MKCITCKTEMECYDDMVLDHIRIDIVKCPKCGSKAEVHYHPRELYITKINWVR